jgi:hypothetical protein
MFSSRDEHGTLLEPYSRQSTDDVVGSEYEEGSFIECYIERCNDAVCTEYTFILPHEHAGVGSTLWKISASDYY